MIKQLKSILLHYLIRGGDYIHCLSLKSKNKAKNEGVEKMQTLKKTVMLLICVMCMTGSVFAADIPQPQEVIRGQTENLQTIEKVYVLPNTDDERLISTENFTENEVEYTFVEMKKQDNTEEDVKVHTETKSIHTNTNNTQTVISKFAPNVEISTEDGYAGTLNLDYTTLNVISAGTGKQSYTITESRSYPNLVDADTSLVPKSINKDGATLNLTGISWQTSASDNIDGQELAVRYTANATYSGTGTKTYTKGYTATAMYKGEIKKIINDTVTYTAVFKEVPKPVQEKKSIKDFWWIFPIAAGMLGGIGYGVYRIIRKRKKGF